VYSNSHSMGASAGAGIGPGESVRDRQRISPSLVPWCFRVVVFNA
jgi:hypothetical protein